MATSSVEAKKAKARELELARRFTRVVDLVPVSGWHSFVRNLVQGLTGEDSSASAQRWGVTPKTAAEFVWPVENVTELPPRVGASENRFDVVLPTAPFVVEERLFTSIVVEFKLGTRNRLQLEKYAAAAPHSLVVSISTDTAGDQPLERNGSKFWVHQTWEHVYYALHAMLSADAGSRVVAVEEPDDLLLKFDTKIAGQDKLSFELESFLELIVDRGLLPDRNLTLVVPVGKNAAPTLMHSPPYYAHPATWTPGYRYLVSIKGNTVLDVYEVRSSKTTAAGAGETNPPPDGIEEGLWKHLCEDTTLRVSVLDSISGADQTARSLVQKKYVNPTGTGRNRTFTQTHRYFSELGDLAAYFRVTSA